MCLLIDHGLRVGEVSWLPLVSIDRQTRLVKIHHRKVNLRDVHEMSPDTLNALDEYLKHYTPVTFLLVGNGDDGRYTESAITHHVAVIGRKIGIDALSPHDCRHFMAWYQALENVSINKLRQAGGWKTLVMPDRYIGNNVIANEGIKYV